MGSELIYVSINTSDNEIPPHWHLDGLITPRNPSKRDGTASSQPQIIATECHDEQYYC